MSDGGGGGGIALFAPHAARRKGKAARGADADADAGPPRPPPSSAAAAAAASSDAFASLAPWLRAALHHLRITRPTPVQSACIPPALNASSVHAAAPTGSGKTAAYALPLLHRWSANRYGVYALVLLPSRELVVQVAETFSSLGARAQLSVCRVSGGLDMDTERRNLCSRPHVVAATPGRLADHLRNDRDVVAAFARCRAVVYDEADRLLEPSFEPDMVAILDALPRGDRQSFLFSATITADVARAARAMARSFVYVDPAVRKEREDDGARVPPSILQTYLWLPSRVRDAYVFALLNACMGDALWREGEGLDRIQGGAKAARPAGKRKRGEPGEAPPAVRSAIVFCGTREQCELLHATAVALGAKAGALHAGMRQRDREDALLRFRGAGLAVLFATDVASRGLDVPTVDLVVNASLPRDPAAYVHRAGRAAREQGAKGYAVSLVCERDVSLVHAIEAYVRSTLALNAWVGDDDVLRHMAKVCAARKVASLRLAEERDDAEA